jgi:enterobactin synthetase component D / holo-[acyl-carrier protein] synthase
MGTAVIEEIVPPQVIVEEAFGDLPHATLYPEEGAVIAKAVGKRRREFATGRACARAALSRLGRCPGGHPPWKERCATVAAGRGGQHHALRRVPGRRRRRGPGCHDHRPRR